MKLLDAVAAAVLVTASLLVGIWVGNYMLPMQRVTALTQSISYTCWTPDRLESFQLTVQYSATNPHWAFTDCTYLSERLSGGRTVIQVDVGASGVPVVQFWPDGVDTQYSSAGIAEFAMGPSNCDPVAGRTGALSIYVDSQTKSDIVTGMCLPLNRHVVFILTFRQGVTPPTPTAIIPTPGGPTPSPSIFVTKQQMIQWLQYGIDLLSK